MLTKLPGWKFDDLARACAHAVGPVEFLPTNNPSADFERNNLPERNISLFARALVAEARKTAAQGASVGFKRVIHVSPASAHAFEQGAQHLENLLALEMAEQGLFPSRVCVGHSVLPSLGTLAHFHLSGIVLKD